MNGARNGKKKTLALFVALILSAAVCLPWAAQAAPNTRVVYTYQDQVSSTVLPVEKPSISGEHMVWVAHDEAKSLEIFYLNLTTGESKQITKDGNPKDAPKVGHSDDGNVYIAWSDKRNMYGYDMKTGRTRKLSSKDGMYVDFSISGSDVVWYDNYTGNLTHYDLKLDKETDLGPGRSPAVADGKVLYKNRNDGGLSLRVLATGETRSVLNLPYHLNVINLAFNGKYALYKQADLDWHTKYVLLDTTDPNAKPIDLTPAVKKQNEYYQIYIGDNQAAWIQDNNGTPELKGVNLAKAETHTIATGEEAHRTLAISNDQVLLRTPDMRLLYRSIIRTEVAVPSGYGSPIPADSVRKIIGAEGGELAAPDGSVKLRIPAGAVARETEFELKLNRERTDALAVLADGSTLRPASKAWDVRIGADLNQNAELTFVYEPAGWTDLQTRKMVAYRWEDSEGSWSQPEGRLDAGNRSVTASVKNSGTYALMVNDVTFGDTNRHWAKAYIEILASRGIVDGIGEGRFAPDDSLTRAQFVKMLLGALGIRPESGAVSPFADVPSSHWSAGWISAAKARGLVQGDGERFDPDAELTREQMMIMLVRAMGDEDRAKTLSDAEIEAALDFKDASDISDWAKAYAALSARTGLIEGDNGMIRPKQSSTRAQAAAVVYRLLVQLQKIE